MKFLPENSWVDQYELTLHIYEEYSTVLFVKKRFEELISHIDVVLNNARCLGDEMKVQEMLISALFLSGATTTAVDSLRAVLDSLGFPFPAAIDNDSVDFVINTLNKTTKELTVAQLHSYPLMTESVPLQAMRIMSCVTMPFSLSSPTMFPMMACQMMQLTLQHGLCLESALAFANFGYSLSGRCANLDDGYRHGKISLAILDRFKDTKRLAKVAFIVHGFLSVWKEPIQATVEGLQYSVNQGFLEGDYDNATLNRVVLLRQALMAGMHLSKLRDKQESLCREMMYNKAKKKFFVSFNPALGDLYTLLALTGDTDESIESIFATTRKENEDILLQRYDISKVETAARVVYYHRVLRSFWFRDYETVLNCSKKYDQCNKTKELLRSVDIWMVLFFGIACFVVSRKDNNIRLMSDGEQQLTTMQKWEHACKWNFENKALLLQAEFYYARKEHEQAKACYERSIASAKQHNFLHEEALANEMFGIFCVETGDSARAASVLEEARRLYQQWGAHEKASRLLPL
eukprot:g10744.t1 g10744   contig4:2454219-2455935(-)